MAPLHDLVLVGGGHAHVQVLRRLAMRPVAGARTTLVVDRPIAVYSGMVPGFVAGQYRRDELEIDVRPLARRAGARVIVAAATRIDAAARCIELEGRAPIPYDTASFDVGSIVAGLDVAGVREHALATRPIGRFVETIETVVARACAATGEFRIAVVGAGAAGVELAATLRAHCFRKGAPRTRVTLVDGSRRLLTGAGPRFAACARRALERRGVELELGEHVASAEAQSLVLGSGARIAFDALVWATGAASLPLFEASRLPTDERGFVRVRATLQIEGADDLFAVGDCARFEPPLPKAGVHAVREGPVLDHNLRARIAGRRLREHRPQRDFLVLLNLGDDTALGAKWDRCVEGPRVFALKDWIDRRFVRRFQALDASGAPARGFAPMEPGEEMRCGGCAAKVGESVLTRALARLSVPRDDRVVLGLEAPDDAAAVRTPGGELVVASIDGFRAFVDDPWLVGRIAAVNAASDLYAKGATPRFALAQVAIPEMEAAHAEELLHQLLSGARAALDAMGVALVGGHTTTAAELAIGFAVWGDAHDPLLRIGGLAPGDTLILTKALGTGVLFHADMRGLARGPWIESAVASMLRPNAAAAAVARELGASACTDVSGFGLAGHLGAMLRASKLPARIALADLPLLPGARELLGAGHRSTFHPENAKSRHALVVEPSLAAKPELDVLFDPQTSGGLLFGVRAERCADALARLHDAGDGAAACIGRVLAPDAAGVRIEIEAAHFPP